MAKSKINNGREYSVECELVVREDRTVHIRPYNIYELFSFAYSGDTLELLIQNINRNIQNIGWDDTDFDSNHHVAYWHYKDGKLGLP